MIRDETGAALPLAIVVVLALSLIGIILYNYNMQETKGVARDEDNLKAHYIARSGAHTLASYLVQNKDLAQEFRDHIINEEDHYLETYSKDVEFADGQYRVRAEYLGNNEIMIKSIGEYSNARQSIGLKLAIRGITAPVIASSINGNPTPALSIKGGDFIYLDDIDNLYEGTIVTLNEDVLEDGYEIREGSHDFDEVILPWNDKKLKMFYGNDPSEWEFAQDTDENDNNYYDKSDELEITEAKEIRYDIEEDNGTRYMENEGGITIEAGGEGNHILLYAENIEMKNAPITVRVADNNVVAIVVDDEIDLDGHGNDDAFVLEALDGCEEGGYLLLYLKTFELIGNDPVVVNDPQVNLNMYVYSDGTVNLSGTPSFKGAIYAPHSDYIFAGDAAIEGWIIARDIEFRGGSGQSDQKEGDIVFSDISMLKTSMDLETVNMKTWHDDIE